MIIHSTPKGLTSTTELTLVPVKRDPHVGHHRLGLDRGWVDIQVSIVLYTIKSVLG